VTYVNTMLDEEWKSLGFTVSGEASDGEFVRRATLDIVGRIPSLAETEAFLKDRSPDRREKLVNRLLASPEYGKNWATVWTHLMIPDGRDAGNMQDVNPEALRGWLEQQFNKNVGWDKVVEQLIAATGRWDENPAVNFIIANQTQGDATRVASYTTRLFLGVQTQCTECHDHPWNEWKQDQFHGVKAFFSNTRERRQTTTLASGQVATDYYELNEMTMTPGQLADRGTTYERRDGQVRYTPPVYLDGRDAVQILRGEKPKAAKGKKPVETAESLFGSGSPGEEPFYLRKSLAKAIVAKDNPFFGRAILNRLWYHYMGHSFVKNVDDFDNGQDEPAHPDLLERITKDFASHEFDLKRLTRWICTSKAYALSSKYKGKENKDSLGSFTTMLVKPLSPEQIYDSVLTLTQIEKTSKSANAGQTRNEFLREFQRTFGTDQEQTAAPRFNGTITQSLMMMNSPLVKRATGCEPGSFLHRVVTDSRSDLNEKTEALYMAAFSRKPSGGERNMLSQLRQRSKSDAEFLEDVLWIILNSGEFMLNY